MPDRVDFWKIPYTWASPAAVVYSVMGIASLVLLWRLYGRARLWWRVGRYEPAWDRPLTRLGRVLRYAVVQTRVLGQRYPGVMHAALAWGFFVFFLGTALATVDSHLYEFLRGNAYLAYKLALDTFTLIFLVGALLAAYRRFVLRPERLTLEAGFSRSLALVVIIVAGGLVTESLRLAVEQPPWAPWMPAGWTLAQVWMAAGVSEPTLVTWHLWAWLFHLATVALLFVTLPAGTLLHVLTGPLNVFFSAPDRPMGALQPLAVASDGAVIYPGSLPDLSWLQLMAADACTECGRCQDACPAHGAGRPLSPKALMTGLRDALRHDGPALLNGGSAPPELIGAVIEEAGLWSCTTCGACVKECPVLIQHLDTIVALRRRLVIDGRVDPLLQAALANLARYGNSFGKSERMRAKWTRSIEPQPKDARKERVEYLWFLGDYAAYNPIAVEGTTKMAAVLRQADVDFGLLYEGERNAGNDVRRVGEEGLFEMLVEQNVSALARADYGAIVTADPHSYNALKNEYPPEINGRRSILHHTELFDQLIRSGQLRLEKKLGATVTYLDPCYLGRYNGIYRAPRRLIEATGCRLVEMPRHGARALCCGAGGGCIWMEEGTVAERPSETRIREAAELTGVEMLVVACPKDLTMYRDAVKTTGHEGRIEVREVLDLVHEAAGL